MLSHRQLGGDASGDKHFGDATIDDHDGHVGHILELGRRFLVEGTDCVLDAVTHGQSTCERNFATIADLLPVVTRHQSVRKRTAVHIIDVQNHDDRLIGGHVAIREALLEVRDAVGVHLERVLAVVLLDRTDHRNGLGVVEHQLAVDLANDRSGSFVVIFDPVPIESGTADAEVGALLFLALPLCGAGARAAPLFGGRKESFPQRRAPPRSGRREFTVPYKQQGTSRVRLSL